MSTGCIRYAIHEGVAVIQFTGDVRYTPENSYRLSASLAAFIDRLFDRESFDHVLLDFTGATGIDSTNLGVVAKIAQCTEERLGERATLLSTQPDITRILQSVGFNQIFDIVTDPRPTAVETADIPQVGSSERQRKLLVLEAHERLYTLNEENQEMFRDIIRLLENEIYGEEDS